MGASTVRLTGNIVDARNNEALIGALVYVEQVKRGVVSDRQGNFTLDGLTPGTYTVQFSYVGYKQQTQHIVLTVDENKRLTIALEEELQTLEQVMIVAKSEARKIREQAMPISVISMSQMQGQVSDMEGILAKTVGIAIRQSGGVGSASRISLRGLEGKRIGYFIEGTSLSDQSDFLTLNDIPVDMIDRIEVYKGVVPAKLGGSSMGGAVNLVLKDYPEHYADISYSYESFNTHRAQTVFKRNIRDLGLVWGIGGGYTYTDNNYTMRIPTDRSLKVRRNHDAFQKYLIGGSIKAHKWWFDKIEIEPAYSETRREIQGIEYDIRKAETISRLIALASTVEKTDFFIPGLDFEWALVTGYTQFRLIDTAQGWHDWHGRHYPSNAAKGGELTENRWPSKSDNRKFTLLSKLNLEYLLTTQHVFNWNTVYTLANGYPRDPLKEETFRMQMDFNSHMHSLVSGLSYDFHSPADRFLNSLTAKFYLYSMDTQLRDIYTVVRKNIALDRKSWELSDAMRFRITSSFLAKLSVGYDVRIPAESELLGDGINITPAQSLLPERNTSLNAGLLYDLTGQHATNLQIEVSAFYMYLQDMIRFEKGYLGAQYVNFGEMRSLGAEFEIKADIFSFLYAYANATYQDLRDVRKQMEASSLPNPTKGKRMPNIPWLMGNAGLEFHRENLFGGTGQNTRLYGDVAFTEEYLYDFEITKLQQRRIPRSLTFDVGLEHSFLNQRLFISGSIKNLADAELLSEFNRPLPGRSFGVKVRYILK